MHKIYISSSTQNKNLGVGSYGTEEENMSKLADMVKDLLVKNGNFEVFRNGRTWTLDQIVNDCNDRNCELFIDNHTNSSDGNAEGLEVYFYGQGGSNSKSFKIASLLYNEISPVYTDKDRGLKADTSLYKNGLYVIQNTKPPATLIEHIFHSDIKSVNFFKANMQKYAYAEYIAICKYFNVLTDLSNNEEYYKNKFMDLRDFINETLNYGGH